MIKRADKKFGVQARPHMSSVYTHDSLAQLSHPKQVAMHIWPCAKYGYIEPICPVCIEPIWPVCARQSSNCLIRSARGALPFNLAKLANEAVHRCGVCAGLYHCPIELYTHHCAVHKNLSTVLHQHMTALIEKALTRAFSIKQYLYCSDKPRSTAGMFSPAGGF